MSLRGSILYSAKCFILMVISVKVDISGYSMNFFLINKLLKYFYRFKITQIVYGVSGNYVLNYLGTRPNLATYVSQSLIQVIKFR